MALGTPARQHQLAVLDGTVEVRNRRFVAAMSAPDVG